MLLCSYDARLIITLLWELASWLDCLKDNCILHDIRLKCLFQLVVGAAREEDVLVD